MSAIALAGAAVLVVPIVLAEQTLADSSKSGPEKRDWLLAGQLAVVGSAAMVLVAISGGALAVWGLLGDNP